MDPIGQIYGRAGIYLLFEVDLLWCHSLAIMIIVYRSHWEFPSVILVRGHCRRNIVATIIRVAWHGMKTYNLSLDLGKKDLMETPHPLSCLGQAIFVVGGRLVVKSKHEEIIQEF